MELRRCRTCGEEKPLSGEYFYKHETSSRGLMVHCILCARARSEAKRRAEGEKPRAEESARRRAAALAASLSSTKACRRCQEIKPRTPEHFCKDASRLDGLAVYCRSCHAQYTQETRERSPEQRARDNQSTSRWYQKNREAVIARRRERRRAEKVSPPPAF